MINNNNKNKKNVNQNFKDNYNVLMDNLTSINEKEDNNGINIENDIKLPRQKKQRLSLVFDIGEKSPFKFNEKVLGYDHMKYISPTITPDNRKGYRKNEIQFTNQPLISPMEEELLQENLKIKNNMKGQKEKEKLKNIKANKNDVYKKKGKSKYELQFKEAKHYENEISQITKDKNVFSNLNSTNENDIVSYSKNTKNNLNYNNINDNNNLNKNKNHDPIDIIIIDENNKEIKVINNVQKEAVNDKNKIEEKNVIENFEGKISKYDSTTNDNICYEHEPLSADLFKDTEDDILLSSKLSDDEELDLKENNNVNLIENPGTEDIIISSVDLKNEKEIIISSNLDTKDNNIKIEETPNFDATFDEDKLSSSNFIDNYNIDNYDNQMLIDNSQNDEIIFNNSQINKIENDIIHNEKMLSLNDIKKKDIVLNNDDDKKLVNIDSQSVQELKNQMDNNIIQYDNILNKNDDNLQSNLHLNSQEKLVNKNFNNIITHKSILNDNSSKTVDNSIILPKTKSDKINDVKLFKKLENSIIDNNEKVVDKERENNEQNKFISLNENMNNKLSSEIKSDSSLLLSKDSSNSNFFSSNNNLNNNKNKDYSLRIDRLKSILTPNKNHKNKEPFYETDCHCLHLNKNVKRIVVGKYANDSHKNWLIMETDNAIEIWKYEIYLNSSGKKNYCNWTKFSERTKNFCEEIKDIKISPNNDYIVIIGSNYSIKSNENYYRCGLIIDIYTLNETYLDIKINDTINTSVNEDLNLEFNNNYSFSKICFPLSEFNIKKVKLNYEEENNKLFVPGYKNGQLIEFTIKNLSIESCTYPISKNSSSPLINIISYDDNNNPSIIGLMKDKIVIWNIKTKEISSEILLSSIPIYENIRLISSIIPPIEYITNLNKQCNNNTISKDKFNFVNNYYSIILYSEPNNIEINKKEKDLKVSINIEMNESNIKKESFGVYTFLNNEQKDSIFYQTSLINGEHINNEEITCYEDSENYIFIGYESGKIIIWEKNSREISAILSQSKNNDCVVIKNNKVLSLSFHYIYPRALLINENTPGLLFANYEDKRIVVFYIC